MWKKVSIYRSWIVGLIVAILPLGGCVMYPLQDGTRKHVTCTVSVHKGDGIVIHVLNYSDVTATTRVRIYQNTGAGAQQVVDSGDRQVADTWQWGLGYTVKESGEYWVEIETNTEKLVPKVAFEKYDGSRWVPIIAYQPDDFAVFDEKQHRLW